MRNPVSTSTAIKALANYLDENADGASSYASDREIRRRKIRAVRDELDKLSASARASNVTYFQFQLVLEQLHSIGASVPDDLVSDIKGNLFDH